jgi:hypothetical protein
MRKETHRLNPVGFFRGKGLFTDVTILSQELCASRRAIFGREGSRRPSCESDSGIGGIDRSHRREGKEHQQVRLMTPKEAANLALNARLRAQPGNQARRILVANGIEIAGRQSQLL